MSAAMLTYLPAVHSDNAQASAAQQFAAWWLYRLGERRQRMVEDSRLVAAAQAHAEYLAGREDTAPSMHVGANGSTPNQRVRAAGYRLPEWHGDGNTVESCSYSHDAVDETVDDLMASPAHHDHLWGKGFFADHVVYGIGQAGAYYVVLIAPAEE